ncbi:MAG: YbgA family protein [Pontibacterium sp.]
MKNKNVIATKSLEQSVTAQTIEKTRATLIQVGLSACLAGYKVRYNGGHTQSRLCLDILSDYFNFKTFCPEVAAGFGTPRPAMRLIGNPEAPRLTFSNDETVDLSAQLINGFEDKLPEMSNLDGYILMKNSPSCGAERVKVYQPNGHPHTTPGIGLFAQALKAKYPNMPIEEEGRLNDDTLYDNFVMRVYAHYNFRKEVLTQPSLVNLIKFHASYKYILMAHNQQQAKRLGRIVASPKNAPLEGLINRYFAAFMCVLSKPANRKNHTNTLLHILGYLKKSVPSQARKHIVAAIFKYKDGIMPLATPLTLLTHYLSQYGSNYINAQRYLQPYPEQIHYLRKYCH